MAWKDLTIAQKSQYMNMLRPYGLTLSEMRQFVDSALSSPIVERTDKYLQNAQAPVYVGGGEKPEERRKVGDHYLTLEQYKELQRDTIRKAAVQKALTRNRGVAPVINGKPESSCIYTFTDNYGRKYQVAGTQTFAANPEKYGFEVAGPVTRGMEGNMYLQLNEFGVPYHATMITGYTDEGEPLLTYSSGHAGGYPGSPIPRDSWNNPDETYEHYLERYNRTHSPEADYHKNTKAWHSPQYETYRFIGTPDDNALWEQQFNEFQPAPVQVETPQVLNNQVQTEFKSGGQKKRETTYARKYREEQEAKAKKALEHPTLSNVFRNDTTDTGEQYYDIVNARYNSAMEALRRKGFNYEDASRLAPMMVTQNVLEGGWRLSRPDNNFGGMQVNGKFLTFDSPDAFYDAYIDMLDQKWGSSVARNNWRNAQNLDDWARILNHEELNLWSKERYNAYNREHSDSPVYLYAPEWENNSKSYRTHLAGVEPRVNTYLDMVLNENPYTEEMYNAPIEPTAQLNDGFNLSMDQFRKLLESNREDFAKGGHKIHIKKENRGKFTALKKRTGHSASWFKAHGTPAQKKMAIFALNSRHWGKKKEHGGVKF